MLRTKFAMAVAVGALIGGVGLVTVASNPVGAGQVKVDVCHADAQGNLGLVNVAEPAYLPHLDHGDPAIGSSYGPGLVYGGDCAPEVVPSSPVRALATSCNQPGADTWNYATTATIGEGWSVVVNGGAGTVHVNTSSTVYTGSLTITDPLGVGTVQPFAGGVLRPVGCGSLAHPVMSARFLSTTSYVVDGGWEFQATFVVEEAASLPGYTWTSTPDGVPMGPLPTGISRTYTSQVLSCNLAGVPHGHYWFASNGHAGTIAVAISKPAGCGS